MIPGGFIPAVEKGVREAMRAGTVAGYPIQDVKVTLFDGQHHSVDSSEMAFKMAGSMAFKDAMEKAQPTLMEPIMTVTVTVPEEYVGDVIGDPQLAPRAPCSAWSRRARSPRSRPRS